jgi:hypothetical protein
METLNGKWGVSPIGWSIATVAMNMLDNRTLRALGSSSQSRNLILKHKQVVVLRFELEVLMKSKTVVDLNYSVELRHDDHHCRELL